MEYIVVRGRSFHKYVTGATSAGNILRTAGCIQSLRRHHPNMPSSNYCTVGHILPFLPTSAAHALRHFLPRGLNRELSSKAFLGIHIIILQFRGRARGVANDKNRVCPIRRMRHPRPQPTPMDQKGCISQVQKKNGSQIHAKNVSQDGRQQRQIHNLVYIIPSSVFLTIPSREYSS